MSPASWVAGTDSSRAAEGPSGRPSSAAARPYRPGSPPPVPAGSSPCSRSRAVLRLPWPPIIRRRMEGLAPPPHLAARRPPLGTDCPRLALPTVRCDRRILGRGRPGAVRLSGLPPLIRRYGRPAADRRSPPPGAVPPIIRRHTFGPPPAAAVSRWSPIIRRRTAPRRRLPVAHDPPPARRGHQSRLSPVSLVARGIEFRGSRPWPPIIRRRTEGPRRLSLPRSRVAGCLGRLRSRAALAPCPGPLPAARHPPPSKAAPGRQPPVIRRRAEGPPQSSVSPASSVAGLYLL